MDAAWAAIRAETQPPPLEYYETDGWISLANYAKSTGKSSSSVSKAFMRKVALGEMERMEKYVIASDGRTNRASYFRPIIP